MTDETSLELCEIAFWYFLEYLGKAFVSFAETYFEERGSKFNLFDVPAELKRTLVVSFIESRRRKTALARNS